MIKIDLETITKDTIQQHKKAIEDGKEVEFKREDGWSIIKHMGDSFAVVYGIWRDERCELRLKPEKKLIPWTMNDVPMPVCWISQNANREKCFIDYMNESCVWFKYGGAYKVLTYEELYNWIYSIDGKDWNPCRKEVIDD